MGNFGTLFIFVVISNLTIWVCMWLAVKQIVELKTRVEKHMDIDGKEDTIRYVDSVDTYQTTAEDCPIPSWEGEEIHCEMEYFDYDHLSGVRDRIYHDIAQYIVDETPQSTRRVVVIDRLKDLRDGDDICTNRRERRGTKY